MAISVMLLGIFTRDGMNIWLSILIAIAAGTVTGMINGLIITRMHIIPLIATIGTQMIFRAIAYISNSGTQIALHSNVIDVLGFGKVLGFLPVMLIVSLVVFLIIGLMLKYTILGRKIYSIGSNNVRHIFQV
jgi:ribose/xylose/arabinose/galactoside ABC-type transport system permease subunit